MIVFFEFYVMNFVDFVIDFYSHITSHVSQVFASCTHNTSYSLLKIVHIIVCVYGLTNQVRKLLWVLYKTDLLLKKRGGECLKSKFWKIGFKTCVLEEHFISYSCIFISNIKCFEVSFQKSGYFFKKAFFLEFRSIQSDFRSIVILFKKFSEPLSGSIDRTCFSINRTSWFKFF